MNTHCTKSHPAQNLLCTNAKCTFKTKLETALADHIRTEHARIECKDCGIITIGCAQKLHHENTVHGKETQTHPKVWIQPKKTYIYRRVKVLQKSVNTLIKDNNIYNVLLDQPETPDVEKIKKYFTTTVTEKEFREQLDKLEKWVAKEKASKIKARIQEKK